MGNMLIKLSSPKMKILRKGICSLVINRGDLNRQRTVE